MSPELITKIEAAWPQIVEAVTDGTTLRDACAAAGIARINVFRYRRMNPRARATLDIALEDGADANVDDLDKTICSTLDPRLARVRAEFLWRKAAARNPERYADRSRVDVRNTSIDLSSIIAAAQQRLEARYAKRIEKDVTPTLAALM